MEDDKDEKVKLCRFCSEEIKKGARICIHCNLFQDWRRFLTISNTTLALIIALVTVISATVPPFLRAIERPHSRINLQFLEADQWSVFFSASNSGNRKGTIKSVVIWVYYVDKKSKERYTIVNAFPCERSSHHSEDNIFNPGETKLYIAMVDNSPNGFPSSTRKVGSSSGDWVDSTCKVEVKVINFNGQEETQTFEYDCWANPKSTFVPGVSSRGQKDGFFIDEFK